MRSYVLITGAVGGLGKAFAAECAARGWNLLLTDVRADLLQPLSEGLSRLHGAQVLTLPCDLVEAASRDAFWERVEGLGLRLHMLINVAGLDYEGPFRERRVQELRTMLRLNIEATTEMTRRALERRDPTRIMRIVTVSSLASHYPMPLKAVYAASKRYLLDLTRALREELPRDEVTFTALCPAGLPTTRQALRGIEAQGFMGQITTMNVGDVAARTLDMALKGRGVYVPGWVNRLLALTGALVPPSWVARVVGRRWAQARARSLGVAGLQKGAAPSLTQEASR